MLSSKNIFHKIRFTCWLISAYVKKHVLFLVFGLALGVTLGIKSKDLITIFFNPTQEEKIGVVGNYTQNSLPIEIQNLISYGLTTLDQNWKVVPKLAEKYKTENSGKTFIFYLKKNLTWQDKKPFAVQDINYTFKDVKSKIDNDTTIRFELTEPFAPFPSLVTQPLFRRGLIGLGEYKVSYFEIEGKFISKLILEKPKKKLIFKFYPSENEAINGFKLGEVKILWKVTNTEKLKSTKNIKIVPNIEENRYVGLFFNTKKGVLQEKSFRQALNYAINDEHIKEERVYGPISPSSWAYNPNIKTYDYNLETAQKLLSKTTEASQSATIRLTLTALRPYEKYSKVIADSWKKLGIETRIEVATLPPANFEVLLAAQEITKDPDQYLMWHSTSKLNLTSYNNPRIDKLLEDGRKTMDQKKREEIYFDFQRFLVEDCPAIFLYYPTTYSILRR